MAHEIADRIKRRIVTGDLRPGQRLPSVRKLAGLYRVSVPTMESALHALAALGLIRARPGVGTFVAFADDRMTLLLYVWRMATPWELALVRAATDAWAAPLAAADVRTRTPNRLPKTLDDISWLVRERSLCRNGVPRAFLDADLAFHRAIAASVRGIEIAPALYRQVGERLIGPMMAVADVLAGDAALDEAHQGLATAVLGGDVPRAARGGRHIAMAELTAVQSTLG